MASSYTTNLGIEKIATGEQSGTWGDTTNFNIDILDRLISYKAVGLTGTTTRLRYGKLLLDLVRKTFRMACTVS